MSRTLKFLAVILCLQASLFSAVSLADGRPFRIGMPEDLKPYTFPEAGAWRGIDLDIARELYARLDIDPTFVPMPWARQLRLAERGILDAILTVYCDETSSALRISRVPLYPVGISLFSNREPEDSVDPFELPSDGDTVGIVRDNHFGDLLDNHAKLVFSPARSTPLLLEQLVAKRVDFVLEESLPFLSYARDRGYAQNIREQKIVEQTNVCLAFSNHSKFDFDEDFYQRVESAIEAMKSSGRIDAIIARYTQ